MACLPMDKLLVDKEISSIPAILIFLFSIEVACTDSCPWFLLTLKSRDEISLRGEGCNIPRF
jgi:hypothetical protein